MITHLRRGPHLKVRMARTVAAILSALAMNGIASAATVTFTDGTFLDTSWTASKIVDTTAGATATFSTGQIASGGNPGQFRQVVHTYNAGDIFVAHLNTGAVYDPSVAGAIVSIDFSYDLIHLNPPAGQAVAYGLVLRQNDSYYYRSPLDTIFPATWTSFGATGLTAANFLRLTGSGPSNPNFSAGGGPMTFGYLSANSNTGGAPGIVRTSGIDNWRVSVTSVPLPATAWLLATACAAVAFRRGLK